MLEHSRCYTCVTRCSAKHCWITCVVMVVCCYSGDATYLNTTLLATGVVIHQEDREKLASNNLC